jgi:hypothetical protein
VIQLSKIDKIVDTIIKTENNVNTISSAITNLDDIINKNKGTISKIISWFTSFFKGK